MALKKEEVLKKLFWIDLEMTGLDVNKEVIIEVGAIITDLEFNVLETYQTAVQQDKKYLDKMDDWNQKTHKESGLLALIPKGKTPEQTENDLIALINRHFDTNELAVIAGNSISQDRLFIEKYFLKLSKRLHYRMLDVTAFKVILQSKHNLAHKKKNAHRSVDDIRESIEELKFYLSFLDLEKVKTHTAAINQAPLN